MVNYAGSKDAAEAVAKEIEGMGVKAMAIQVCTPMMLVFLHFHMERTTR